jgi:hypothetical protein
MTRDDMQAGVGVTPALGRFTAEIRCGDRGNPFILQLDPIQPSLAVPVGNGKYTIADDIISAGVAGKF